MDGGEGGFRAGDPRLFRARVVVQPEWIDANRHMNAAYYLMLVKDPAIELHRHWDYSDAFRARTGQSNFVLAANVVYQRELLVHDRVVVTARITALDRKRMTVVFEVINEDQGYVAALVQYVLGHVTLGPPPRSALMPDDLYERLRAVFDAHAAVPPPKGVERLPGHGGAASPSKDTRT